MKIALKKHLALPEPIHGLTFARGADRLIVARGSKPTLILDAATGRQVAQLPSGAGVSAVDPAGVLAAVSGEGKSVGGRYVWDVSLWDLAKGKKVARLAKNHPEDNVTAEAIGRTRVLGIRKRKDAFSLCLFDRSGEMLEEHRLGDVPLPFHAALSPDERTAAHAYFTGAAQIVDTASGEAQKLAGGVLRIGRQHDKGISELAFDGSGEHLLYVSSGSKSAHVWSARTRRSLAGTWLRETVHDAFFFGDSLAVTTSGSQGAAATIHALATKTKPRVVALGAGSMLFARAGDDRHLACAGHTGGHDVVAKSSLEIYDLVSGKRVAKGVLPAPMKAVIALAACPGKIAVGDRKGGVALFTVD